MIDKDRNLLAWNRAWLELYELPTTLVRPGVKLDEIVRFNARRGLYGEGNEEEFVAKRMRSFFDSTDPVRLRLYPSRAVIEVRSNPLPDGGVVTTYTDVTASVSAEEELAIRFRPRIQAFVTARTSQQDFIEEVTQETLIAVVCAVMLGAWFNRSVLDVSVLHDRNPVFVQLSDGSLRNAFTVKILNKMHAPRIFRIATDGIEGAELSVVGVGSGEPNIEVVPDKKKQGLATYLLSEALRELHQQQGVTLIEAQAMEHNPSAIALYNRLGFTEIDHGAVLRKE